MAKELTGLLFHSGDHLLSFFTTISFSSDAYINAVSLGIGRNSGIVIVENRIKSLFYRRFSKAGNAEDARENEATCIGPQSRNNLFFPHAVHLSGNTWHGYNDTPIFFHPPSRCSTTRIR